MADITREPDDEKRDELHGSGLPQPKCARCGNLVTTVSGHGDQRTGFCSRDGQVAVVDIFTPRVGS